MLEVAASLSNSTSSHFQVTDGAACPFAVRIFPDSTAAYEYIGVVPCPPGGSTFDLAPGDSTTLTRVFSADTLATFAPGTYGINVEVATNTGFIGVWAGAIQLPLKSSP